MSPADVSALCTLLVLSVLTFPLAAQSVISTHSGIVHFSEGAVYLGNEPLTSHVGRFPSVPKGAELRTAEGRAELLLTPTVFLRIDEKSAIRMLTNELSNTRIEMLAGSAVVDSAGPSPGISVTLLYRNWSLRIPEQGRYRIDADTARLWVLQGHVEVSAGDDQRRLSVEQGMYLRFAAILLADRSVDQPRDAFSAWAEARQQAILADNAITASTQDPASIPDPASVSAPNSGDGFTFPRYAQLAMVGVSLGWISHAYFSTSTRSSSAPLPSAQYGFARVLSGMPSRSTRPNGIRAMGLLRPLLVQMQLHLAGPVRRVSRVGFPAGVRR